MAPTLYSWLTVANVMFPGNSIRAGIIKVKLKLPILNLPALSCQLITYLVFFILSVTTYYDRIRKSNLPAKKKRKNTLSFVNSLWLYFRFFIGFP